MAYSTYLATAPPGSNARFGASRGDSVNACVNPGALTDDGRLDAELPAAGDVKRIFGTTFIENPRMFSAKCVVTEGHSYLAVSIGEGTGSTRVTRDLTAMQESLPG